MGVVQLTVAHVVPRSADLRIFEGQFENAGPETSSDLKKLENSNQKIEKIFFFFLGEEKATKADSL